jgi:hypothetical protein
VWNFVSHVKGLSVFENRVLRRIFESTREEVLGRMDGRGHVARIREIRNTCNTLVEKHEQNRPLERPRHRGQG